MTATNMGTHDLAAEILSRRVVIVARTMTRNIAATMPPMTGEMTQLAAMLPIIGQATTEKPAAMIPAPTTPPTTAWVVDTGAPIYVARLTHKAEASRADIITMIKSRLSMSGTVSRSRATVDTTSPPANRAPAASKIAAMTRAPVMEMARAPTAGPILLATSLAPTLSAM